MSSNILHPSITDGLKLHELEQTWLTLRQAQQLGEAAIVAKWIGFEPSPFPPFYSREG